MLENNEEKVEQPTNHEETVVTGAEKAVSDIENEVAQEAEKADEKHEIPMLDYAAMELDALVDELKKLLKAHPIQQ